MENADPTEGSQSKSKLNYIPNKIMANNKLVFMIVNIIQKYLAYS